MIKPQPKVLVEGLCWRECVEYIQQVTGIKDIRDVAGKWAKDVDCESIEYQDFWHELLEAMYHQVSKEGCWLYISEEHDWPGWAQPIVSAFHKEFGVDAEYWTSW